MASAAWGGALGGMLTAMTEVQGLHPMAALAAVSVLAATPAWLARVRPSFAPEVLRDEALLGLCLLGLVVAIVPGVTDGWQAAAGRIGFRAALEGAVDLDQPRYQQLHDSLEIDRAASPRPATFVIERVGCAHAKGMLDDRGIEYYRFVR